MPPQAASNRQTVRGDMYLPAMPDMLLAASPSPSQLRYGRRELVEGQSVVAVQGNNAPRAKKLLPSRQKSDLEIPSPEALGLARDAGAAVAVLAYDKLDWTGARFRLDKLGATFYRLEKTADTKFRFVCAIPAGGTSGRECQFEAVASSEEEVIQQAMTQLDQWLRQQ